MGRMTPLDELVAALPGGVVVTEVEAMEKYRFDWSRDQAAGTPLAVVRAEDADQVQTAARGLDPGTAAVLELRATGGRR